MRLYGSALAAALAIGTLSAAAAHAETYTYDSLGRLSTVVSDDGTQTTYTYDPAGNRTLVVISPPAAQPPVAHDDNYSYAYGPTNPTYDPRTNDTDPGGLALSVASVGTPSYGTASFTATSVTYTPTTRVNGQTDSFVYTIKNTANLTASAQIHIALSIPNPVANPDSASTAFNTPVSLDPRANDSDPAGNPLAVTGVGTPAHGASSFTPTSVTYTPTTGYSGSDNFTYLIANGVGGSASSTVGVTVQPYVGPLSASVSATTWNWSQDVNNPPHADPSIVVTATGGTAPYSYAWQYVSGDTVMTAGSATAASTGWDRTISGYGVWTAVWRCRVTDNIGTIVYAPNVTVTFERDNNN